MRSREALEDAGPVLERTLESCPQKIRKFLGELNATLAATQTDRMRHDVQIVMAEVLNNISKHAYAGVKDGGIRVCYRTGACGVSIIVTDFGRQMPCNVGVWVMPDHTQTRLEDLPESGFGVYLIRTLTSYHSYSREAGCNTLSLRFARR